MANDITLTPSRPRIVVEANIPFIRGVMEPWADVAYLQPSEITPEVMAAADALVTRTRVRCDEHLLAHSPCSIIASATIGLDHVDIPWCEAHGIEVRNAPGCNAPAVAQYVLASALRRRSPEAMTLGIVGVGNVGRIVERWAKALGIKVLRCDPPRARREGADGFVDLDTIAREADVITFHTPYTTSGPDATHHLCSRSFLAAVKRTPLIINAARGGVVDTAALIEAIDAGTVEAPVIDCWEGEPDISAELLSRAYVATPHIAGYSFEGKARATQMAVDAICRHFGVATPQIEPCVADAPAAVSAAQLLEGYDPLADTAALRANPTAFEQLRTAYHLRHEPLADVGRLI